MEKLTPLQIIGAVVTGLVAAGAALALGYWLVSSDMSNGDDPQRRKHLLPNDLESGQLYLPPRNNNYVPMSTNYVPTFALSATREKPI